ncbi:MAG: hypothetical protein K8R23_03080, partial [Chthoniobacter sp.]|nr:hypothetical protein [Chthoniobacter sp.]
MKEAEALPYRPAKLGEQFGPLWATFWFKGTAKIPQQWDGRRVDLLWISHSEATLWLDGQTAQGLNYEPAAWAKAVRPDAILRPRAKGGETVPFRIEMACNRLFGDNPPFFKQVSNYILDQCEIAAFDPLAWEMWHDFSILQQLECEGAIDLEKDWAGKLLAELNRFANAFDPEDQSTWADAHWILKSLYQNRNGSYKHELSAIGHAHIDTAWLWPLAETYRKCERTFSSAAAYMEEYQEYKFSCSQAQQYAWIKER